MKYNYFKKFTAFIRSLQLNFLFAFSQAVKYIPGKSYEVLLAIRATQNVTTSDPDNPSGVNYKISMTDASFSFATISSCIIADRTAGECSCSAVTGNTYQMLVSCASDLVISGSATYNEITI